MKRFVNGIEEHHWADFCQDMIERRDGKKYPKDCNYKFSLSEYGEFYNHNGGSTIHLRAEEISSGALFEIRLQYLSPFIYNTKDIVSFWT